MLLYPLTDLKDAFLIMDNIYYLKSFHFLNGVKGGNEKTV